MTATATRPARRTLEATTLPPGWRNHLTSEEKATDTDVQERTNWRPDPTDPLAIFCHSPFVHMANERGQDIGSYLGEAGDGQEYRIAYSERHGEWRCSCGARGKCWHQIAFELLWLPLFLEIRKSMRAAVAATIPPPAQTIPLPNHYTTAPIVRQEITPEQFDGDFGN